MSVEVSEVVIIMAAGTIIVLLLLIFLLVFFFVFQKKQLQNKQEKTALHIQYAHEILQTQIEVQNSTMQQIGAELHDNIGQLLFVAKIHLNVLQESDQDPENQQRIVQAHEIIGLSIAELRSLTKSFDGDFVKDFGLEESLSHELLRIRKTNRYETEMNVLGERFALGYEKEIVLFRIAQEVFNNIMKHAKAASIKVMLTYEPGKFILSIKDDGKGFDYPSFEVEGLKSSGAGLRNMRRRAELIGGKFSLTSSLGNGTQITVELTQI